MLKWKISEYYDFFFQIKIFGILLLYKQISFGGKKRKNKLNKYLLIFYFSERKNKNIIILL